MGHLYIFVDQMGLYEMGLDEMGINRGNRHIYSYSYLAYLLQHSKDCHRHSA